MDKHQIFPYNIWNCKIENYKELNENLISEIYNMRNNDNTGFSKSNLGGWHSSPEPRLFDGEYINQLKKIITNLFSKELLKTDKHINITGIWANINYKGCVNSTHDHKGAYYSGVYYVKVPENSGNLYLLNPSLWYTKVINENRELFTIDKDEYKQVEYKPEEGDIYFFTGEIPHGVTKNMSNEDRISVAFNFNFEDIFEGLQNDEDSNIKSKRM